MSDFLRVVMRRCISSLESRSAPSRSTAGVVILEDDDAGGMDAGHTARRSGILMPVVPGHPILLVNRVRRRVATLTVSVLGKDPELNRTLTRIRCFLAGEDGPTSVEYAVLAALIVVLIAGVSQIGQITSSSFGSARSALAGS